MQENLVIVESPAKAKTIEKFLGKDYKVMSSYGHIRDLKKKELSIDLDTLNPDYEIRVKSRNERNPYLMLPALRVGTHERLPQTMRRKAGMTSNHHAPYVLGFTHATMAGTEGCDTVRWS